MFESLEQRRLLAHTLEAGVLTVTGTVGPDHVNIALREGNLVIRVNHQAPAQVPAADVNSIVVNGLAGNDLLAIAPNVDKDSALNGGLGNDVLNGGGGDDNLNGGDGNDRLNGGLGGDVMIGGDGIDGVDYSRRTADITVTLDDNADDGAPAVGSNPGEGDNVSSDVEGVHTGSGDDTIVGSPFRNQLDGGAGDDDISGAGGNDTALGGPGNDELDGGEGNDLLDGGGGADDMSGGAGLDTVSYARSPAGVVVTLDGVADDGIPASPPGGDRPAEGDNAGADVENVQGSRFDDSITGNASNNRLIGGAGDDVLRGGEGNDYLDGGHGEDELFGEGGNDILRGRDGQADLLDGGGGEDRADRDPLDTLVDVEHSNPLPP